MASIPAPSSVLVNRPFIECIDLGRLSDPCRGADRKGHLLEAGPGADGEEECVAHHAESDAKRVSKRDPISSAPDAPCETAASLDA